MYELYYLILHNKLCRYIVRFVTNLVNICDKLNEVFGKIQADLKGSQHPGVEDI